MKLKLIFLFIVYLFSGQEVVRLSEAGEQANATSDIIITKADIEKVGTSIPTSAIGEPVNSVKIYNPRWVDATESSPAFALVEGSIFPVDPNGWPIN